MLEAQYRCGVKCNVAIYEVWKWLGAGYRWSADIFVEMLNCVSTCDQDRAKQKVKILMIEPRTLLRNGYLNPLALH